MKKIADETTEYQCPLLDQCELICERQTDMPGLVRRVRDHRCTKKRYSQCARFLVHKLLGPGAVPPMMFPCQTDWASLIIEEHECDAWTDEQVVETQ